MLYIVKIAWRNLGRHRGRTLLSILAVLVGVFVVVISKGFVDGFLDTMMNYNINLNSGHLRIIRPEYEVKERLLSLSYPIGEDGQSYSQMVSGLRKIPGVQTATGRVRFGMLLVTDDNQEPVMGMGVDFTQEEKINHLSRFLKGEGAGKLPSTGKQEIIMGRALMDKLHVRVGEKINVLFTTSFGSFKAATFRVTGAMNSGLKLLDESLVYVPLDVTMNLLDLEDSVTEIVVFTENINKVSEIRPAVQDYLEKAAGYDLKIVPWNQYNEFIQYLDKAKAAYSIIYVFLVLLASFVVFNTLLMVVSERTREIGMLAALGMTPAAIKQVFLWEAVVIAVTGSLVGAIFGGLFNYFFSRTGIDLSEMMTGIGEEFLFTPTLYPVYDLKVLIFAFVLGIIVTMGASYLPARKAGSLKPTEALRAL